MRLPTAGSFDERLADVAVATREAKRHLRGASTALLAPAFGMLDRLGGYQQCIGHQRQIHTFVSSIRGPGHGLTLLGHPLVKAIPVSLASGNITVAFTALSYENHLVLTVNANPRTCPDLDRLMAGLADGFAAIASLRELDHGGAT